MPRYLLARGFPDGLTNPIDDTRASTMGGVAQKNAPPVNKITEVRVLDPCLYH